MRVKSSDDENDDTMDLSEAMQKAEDDPNPPLQENEMTATKKTKAAPPAKPTKAAAEKKGTFGPRAVPEGYTGLAKIAEELGIKPSAARRKLRTMEGLEKPAEGWCWKDGSKALSDIKKALTASAE